MKIVQLLITIYKTYFPKAQNCYDNIDRLWILYKMTLSWVRLAKSTLAWTSFGVGGLQNLLAVWAIVKHTPKVMRVYSCILLQTCVSDLALLLLTVLADPVRKE